MTSALAIELFCYCLFIYYLPLIISIAIVIVISPALFFALIPTAVSSILFMNFSLVACQDGFGRRAHDHAGSADCTQSHTPI